MEKYIFTFSDNHPLANHVQPVFAGNPEKARIAILKRYGREWGFQWTGDQWDEWANDRNNMGLQVERELNPMYCREV